MRIVRMRWDMAICFFLMVVTMLGLFKLGEKVGLLDKAGDMISSIKLPGEGKGKNVPDGEVGGYATEDLPILETEEEFRDCDGYFTVKVTSSYNLGSVQGKKYNWKVLKLDNNKMVAVKLNSDKVQKIEEGNKKVEILPTGVCVYKDCEAYALMKQHYSRYDIIDDFYIDMDGKANSSKATPSWAMFLFGLLMIGAMVLFLAFVLGITMLYHSIGVKIGIFPPIFLRNKKENN